MDIDGQAVEVTKLSLLLKVLEGENEETINKAKVGRKDDRKAVQIWFASGHLGGT